MNVHVTRWRDEGGKKRNLQTKCAILLYILLLKVISTLQQKFRKYTFTC